MMLNYPEHRYDLDDPVELDFLSQLEVIKVSVTHMDVTNQIILFGSISVGMFDLAIKSDAFHLACETSLPTWDIKKEIEITLRLDQSVAQSYPSSDEVFIALFQKDSALLHAASWYALEAMQREKLPWDPESDTTFGIRTRWAE